MSAPSASPPVGLAAAKSGVLNGTTELPSLEVPSANSTTWSPAWSRLRISLAFAVTSVRRVRSTNTEPCSLASQLTKGHDATSCLATKETGATAESTVMSSQETWLEMSSTPWSRATPPSMFSRTPTMRHTWRWYQ